MWLLVTFADLFEVQVQPEQERAGRRQDVPQQVHLFCCEAQQEQGQ